MSIVSGAKAKRAQLKFQRDWAGLWSSLLTIVYVLDVFQVWSSSMCGDDRPTDNRHKYGFNTNQNEN
jgi:hypothetical protein